MNEVMQDMTDYLEEAGFAMLSFLDPTQDADGVIMVTPYVGVQVSDERHYNVFKENPNGSYTCYLPTPHRSDILETLRELV